MEIIFDRLGKKEKKVNSLRYIGKKERREQGKEESIDILERTAKALKFCNKLIISRHAVVCLSNSVSNPV